jgi:hypothetical protein
LYGIYNSKENERETNVKKGREKGARREFRL